MRNKMMNNQGFQNEIKERDKYREFFFQDNYLFEVYFSNLHDDIVWSGPSRVKRCKVSKGKTIIFPMKENHKLIALYILQNTSNEELKKSIDYMKSNECEEIHYALQLLDNIFKLKDLNTNFNFRENCIEKF